MCCSHTQTDVNTLTFMQTENTRCIVQCSGLSELVYGRIYFIQNN